jgi:InsA N-terminal domain/InsA C-terminal domain
MIMQVLHCPNCQGTDIVRHGKTRQGPRRYRCREQRCAGRTLLLDYTYPGQSPEVKRQIIEMALNASGMRDTDRVLHVSTKPSTPGWRGGAGSPCAACYAAPDSPRSGPGEHAARGRALPVFPTTPPVRG